MVTRTNRNRNRNRNYHRLLPQRLSMRPLYDNLTIIEIKPLTFQINFYYYLHTNEFDSLSLLRWNWHWQKKTRV